MARILVIDDDAFMRQMFADALAEAGHSVRLADDGPQGLLLLDEAPPDLVIADMVLSRMTGPQLVQEIRKRNPSVPIIAVSGLPPERIWPCVADEDFPDGLVFAPKPIEWERFLRIVGTLASSAGA